MLLGTIVVAEFWAVLDKTVKTVKSVTNKYFIIV